MSNPNSHMVQSGDDDSRESSVQGIKPGQPGPDRIEVRFRDGSLEIIPFGVVRPEKLNGYLAGLLANHALQERLLLSLDGWENMDYICLTELCEVLRNTPHTHQQIVFRGLNLWASRRLVLQEGQDILGADWTARLRDGWVEMNRKPLPSATELAFSQAAS